MLRTSDTRQHASPGISLSRSCCRHLLPAFGLGFRCLHRGLGCGGGGASKCVPRIGWYPLSQVQNVTYDIIKSVFTHTKTTYISFLTKGIIRSGVACFGATVIGGVR